MPERQSLGPVVLVDGRLVPEPSRPGSQLSQWLLLDALFATAPHVGGHVLDVGCGKKPYASVFAARAESYLGCDWPPEHAQADDHRADVFADAMRLPFASQAFDTVLCTEVLEHLPDPRLCISEMARVLRPGGALLVSVPFFYWLHEYPRDYYRYTEYGLRHLLSEAGFDVTDIRRRGGVLAVLLDLQGKAITHFSKRLGARLPGGSLLVIAASLLVRFVTRLYLVGRRALRGTTHGRVLATGMSMERLTTLGYVVLARKR